MLVVEKRCKVCIAIKTNKPLLKRLYNSSWFIPHSKDSMLRISEETGLPYKSIHNHLRRHQFIDSRDYTEKMLHLADKQAEKKAVRQAVKAVDAVQTVIEKGMERLENGDITVNTDQLIRASQVKLTQDAKQKDQELATIEMVAHFLSGENSNERVFIESNEDEDARANQ